MMSKEPSKQQQAGPWNPDIKSTLPSQYLPLSTMFRAENVTTSIEEAGELADFTGLPMQQLICFRPARLVVHELLVRVSADIFVSDGSRYEDLGVNFRTVVTKILADYIEPQMPQIVASFEQMREQCRERTTSELTASLFPGPVKVEAGSRGFSLSSLFRAKPEKKAAPVSDSIEQKHQRLRGEWEARATQSEDALDAAMYRALAYITNAIIIRHGRIIGEQALLVSLVVGQVCNHHGSDLIGEAIAPLILKAAKAEGYRLLPPQGEPVVINVKGASASGKSTMRPLQQLHTDKLGLNWNDFALISPDIWRKYLLDYDSLGDAYKYAGTLAGDEIPIIDKKLDKYIGRKAEAGRISHLLIDRFRFDSFAPGRDSEEGSNLLTRFGHTIYLIFMVTPPEATVERAWLRGLQVGRYKAVDDLLDHNIEAFRGIPVLFFTWALRQDKVVHYEFLDNSVEQGQTPLTIAFGLNGDMYIVDFKCMLDITRYTRINIEATQPDDVYPDPASMNAESNTDFLASCARKIPGISFVDRQSGLVYARMESGKMCWVDAAMITSMLDNEETRAGFGAIAGNLLDNLDSIENQAAVSVPDELRRHMLGRLE